MEPNNYIRFSDTVEESSGGLGGLGYCMDDDDIQWLTSFNAKAEGSSGGGAEGAASPAVNGHNNGTTPNQGRGMRVKGKEREKAETPAPLCISEDTFEFVMGVLEKHAEDTIPMLHTVSENGLIAAVSVLTSAYRTLIFSRRFPPLNLSSLHRYLLLSFPAMKLSKACLKSKHLHG